MKKALMAVCIFALALIAPCAALAQDGIALADASEVFDLGEIIVTGTSYAIPQTAVAGEVTSEDFQRLGVQNVPDALNLIPGVRVTVGQKNEPAITIRGFDQDKILVLLDGIPLQDAYYNKLDLASVPLESIAKITVTSGPASSLYGANAMGGVISIVTKKSEQKPSGRLILGHGDDSSSLMQMSYGGSFGKTYLFLAASHQETEGYKLSKAFDPTSPATTQAYDGRRLNSDYNKNHYSLKIGRNTNRNDEYAASFSFTQSERGVPVHAYNPASVSKFSRFARFTDWQSWTIDLTAKQNISKKSTLHEMFYYHKFDNTYESFSNKTFSAYMTPGTLDKSIYDDYTIGFRLLADTVKFGGPLKVALNYNQDVHSQLGNTSATTWTEYKTHMASLGVEKLFKAGKKWEIIPSASYDVYAPETTGVKKYAFNPQANFIYNLDENNKWHFTAAKKTRYPTQSQLFGGSGNILLEPTTSMSYEAGVESKISQRLTGSFTVFYNDVEDLIEKVGGTNQNISSALLSGAEVRFSKSCNGKPCGSLSYSGLRARDRFLGTKLYKTSKGKIDLDLIFPLAKGMSFNLSNSYVMSRYETISATNTTVKPYLLMNAGFSGKLPCVNSAWRVYVDNITDKNYEEEYGYPQAGRTFKAELQYNF